MSALDEARAWLTETLSAGPGRAREVRTAALAAGFSSATLRRARAALGVSSERRDGAWWWSLGSSIGGGAGASPASPAPLEVMASLVLPDGRTWGEAAAPVQLEDARAVLSFEPVARRHWIGRSRGYSKTSDAGGFTIAAVLGGLVGRGERGFFAAADRDQAALAALAVEGWATRTPGLRALVVVESSRVRFPHHDVSVEIMAADTASAWGRTGAWWVVDELPGWDDVPGRRSFYEAVSTAWPKVPTCRVVVIATAGSPSHFAHGVYQAARQSPSWRVSETHEPAPWLDPVELAEERARLSDASFARLWECRWVEASDHLATAETLARCVTVDEWPAPPRRGVRYAIGVDVAVKADNTALAVAHSEPAERGQRRVCLDEMVVMRPHRERPVPLADVADRVEGLARRYNRATVYADPSKFEQGLQRLKSQGVRVEERPFTVGRNDKMTTTLSVLIRDELLALPDVAELLDEILSVRVVEKRGGALAVDTRPGKHDDQVDALGLVATELLARPVGGAGSAYDVIASMRGPRRPFDRPRPMEGATRR